MTYATAEARRQLLDGLAQATDQVGVALAALGEAYEQLDERSADRLEQELFRPVQAAYGKGKRTHAAFAGQSGAAARAFEPALAGIPSTGVKGFIEVALDSVGRADAALAELQDSMLPVEVGDAELRAGLTEIRELIAGLRAPAREFLRILGR